MSKEMCWWLHWHGPLIIPTLYAKGHQGNWGVEMEAA